MPPSAADKAVLQVEQHKYHVAQQGKALAQTIHNFADQLEQLAKEIESTPASAYANGTAVLPNFGVAVNGVLASGSVETKKRKRGDKEKKIKDPNAPKRPPSAYLLYQNQIRHQMKEKYPELPYKEMLGKIADSWGQLGDKEKKQFQDETAQLKTTYESNRAEYERANGIVSKARKSTAAAPAAAVAPVASEEDEDDEVDSEEEEPPAPVVKKAAAVVKEDSSTGSGTESGSDDDEEEEEEEVQEQPKKKQKQVAPPPPPPAAVKDKKAKRGKA